MLPIKRKLSEMENCGIVAVDDDISMETTEDPTTPALPIIPEEIYLKIFENLDKLEDTLNATLVCKQWNGIISNSKKLMKNMKPSFDIDTAVDENNLKSFKITRKYYHLELNTMSDDGYYMKTQICAEIAESLGNRLKTMKLSYICLRKIDLIGMLSCCHSLETLELHYVKNLDFELQESRFANLQNKVNLGQLQILNLHMYEWTSLMVLEFLECSQLHTFEVDFYDYYEEYDNAYPEAQEIDIVVKFLNSLERLSFLSMSNFRWSSQIMLEPKFHWDSLKLVENWIPTNQTNDIALASLQALGRTSNQSAQVEIEDSETHSQIMQVILNSCTTINEMVLNGSCFPSRISQLRQMNEVKTLTIKKRYAGNRNELFRTLVLKMPNVTHLILHDLFERPIIHDTVPIYFRNITFLEIISSTLLSGIQNYIFPNLTTLAVVVTGSEELNALANFCSKNFELKNLEIIMDLGAGDGTKVNAGIPMLRIYSVLCLTQVDNYKLFSYRRRRGYRKMHRKLELISTKGEIEVKRFGKILSDKERSFYVNLI